MGLVRQLTRTLPPVVAGGGIGFLGTKPTSDWYLSLDRPDWEPPAEVFAPVWTTLYALIAGSGAKAMARMEGAGDDAARRSMQRAVWLNMGLNAGWCWLFFTAERPRMALAEIVLLEASTLDLIRRAGKVDKVAAVGLAPYAAWNGFAAALNAEIVRRNG